MKKIFIGALTVLLIWSFGAFTEATKAQYDEQCCRGEYGSYCYQDCEETSDGEYCGRYGFRRR